MYFGLSDDQIFFQDNVKKFLEDNAPLEVIKKIANNEDKSIKDDLHKGIINLGINNFGKSAPYKDIYKHFELDIEDIVQKIKKNL